MTTAGPNIAGTAAQRARGVNNDWVNPTNAQAEDGSFATAVDSTDYLDCTNLGWSLPAGLTISNLLVEVKAKISTGTTSSFAMNLNNTSHTLFDSGSVATVTTTLQWLTAYNGNPPAGFDSVLQGNTDEYEFLGFGGSGATLSVDAVRVTVTYSVGTPRSWGAAVIG